MFYVYLCKVTPSRPNISISPELPQVRQISHLSFFLFIVFFFKRHKNHSKLQRHRSDKRQYDNEKHKEHHNVRIVVVRFDSAVVVFFLCLLLTQGELIYQTVEVPETAFAHTVKWKLIWILGGHDQPLCMTRSPLAILTTRFYYYYYCCCCGKQCAQRVFAIQRKIARKIHNDNRIRKKSAKLLKMHSNSYNSYQPVL
ncbi:hypothetical protein AGLY_004292 [Aphis glycines]|uniref:Uncharacterized protein n=1 Tax=Aphis glycines TaxID=307491 RepID=A0A6G0U043_APHGL|nr:hypothetical protein AGLY_004292 [Aphis glycines]